MLASVRSLLKQPLTAEAIAIALLLAVGEALSPGFASPRQIVNQLMIAALLGGRSRGAEPRYSLRPGGN